MTATWCIIGRWLVVLLHARVATSASEVDMSNVNARALSSSIDYSEMRGPELDGRLTIHNGSFAWHLGGFCFGHTGDEADREVAKIKASLTFDAGQPWKGSGALYLAFFDARDDRWGSAQNQWESDSCADKLNVAAYLDFSGLMVGEHESKRTYSKFGTILQHSGTRDWHATLIGCDVRINTSAAIRYTVSGQQGALSVFAADNLQPNSCPNNPVNWWEAAAVDRTFWIIVGGALALWFLPILVLVNLWRKHRRSATSKGKDVSDKVCIDLEDVVGRPYGSPGSPKDNDIAPLPVGKSCDSLAPLQKDADSREKPSGSE